MEKASDGTLVDMRDDVVRSQAGLFGGTFDGDDLVLGGVVIRVAMEDLHCAKGETETARATTNDDGRTKVVRQ